jgi:hypothetical protein
VGNFVQESADDYQSKNYKDQQKIFLELHRTPSLKVCTSPKRTQSYHARVEQENKTMIEGRFSEENHLMS